MTEQPASHAETGILLSALEFLAQAISIVPTANDGSKRPVGQWKHYQERLPEAAEVLAWATTAQGFGVVTGAVSGNLELLELEGRAVAANLHIHAKDLAYDSGLGDLWDILASTYVEQTPSGGLHWLYRISDHDTPGNTKLARRPGENGGVDVLAETRGEGGYCIVAPSHGPTHPSGQPWVRLNGSTPASIATITWEQREALHTIFKALDQMPDVEAISTAIAPRDPDGRLSPGDDYNQRASWDDILTGWTKVRRQGQETFWRRPGKDIGISASTGKNEADNLYVWTTSTVFEAEKPYSKFAAYTLLNFGDITPASFSTAAKQLRQLGYGDIHVVPDALNDFTPDTPFLPADPQLAIDQETGEVIESSWRPADIASILQGTAFQPITEYLHRRDGVNLIYPARVHSFYGESESGKSWLAQYAVAQTMLDGHTCAYIDFEADAADVVSRLQMLGVPDDMIMNQFIYIRPEGRPRDDDPFWNHFLTLTDLAIVVIDGVTEALTLWGAETKDNDSITMWTRRFPRRIAKTTGAGVITIDHVNKSTETRGRFAIGGQAKLAALDGAAFLIEPIEVLAPGKVGKLSVRVTKDRPGAVRKVAGQWRKSDRTQEVAVVKMDATSNQILMCLDKPMDDDEIENHKENQFRQIVTTILADYDRGLSQTQLIESIRPHIKISGTNAAMKLAAAVEDGWLRVVKEGQRNIYLLDQFPGQQRIASN